MPVAVMYGKEHRGCWIHSRFHRWIYEDMLIMGGNPIRSLRQGVCNPFCGSAVNYVGCIHSESILDWWSGFIEDVAIHQGVCTCYSFCGSTPFCSDLRTGASRMLDPFCSLLLLVNICNLPVNLPSLSDQWSRSSKWSWCWWARWSLWCWTWW